MEIGKWIQNVRGAFQNGPLQTLAQKVGSMVADDDIEQQEQLGQVEVSDDFRELFHKHRHLNVEQRDSFLFALLVLADYVFSVDQTADVAEQKFIRHFLRSNFGRFAERQGVQILQRLDNERRHLCRRDPMLYMHMVGECSRQLSYAMNYEQRLQLLGFLIMIAKVSNGVSEKESEALRDLSIYLKMKPQDFYSMLNAYDDSLAASYKVLGLTPAATDGEVVAAYELMCERHNPERLYLLGDDVQRLAEMRFVKIQEARDRIFLARGMSMALPASEEQEN